MFESSLSWACQMLTQMNCFYLFNEQFFLMKSSVTQLCITSFIIICFFTFLFTFTRSFLDSQYSFRLAKLKLMLRSSIMGIIYRKVWPFLFFTCKCYPIHFFWKKKSSNSNMSCLFALYNNYPFCQCAKILHIFLH